MREAELRRLLLSGLSLRKIAARLGCSFTNVRYWIAKYGILIRRLVRERPTCIRCGKLTRDKAKVNHYCSQSCHRLYKYEEFIRRWLAGEESGHSGKEGTSKRIRKYLFDKHDSKCEKCGWREVNPKTGNIPLTVNHKDGKWRNNRPENLELLCPNCHSLTPNYGRLNFGNGRSKGRKSSG